jgi:hypothetical protein
MTTSVDIGRSRQPRWRWLAALALLGLVVAGAVLLRLTAGSAPPTAGDAAPLPEQLADRVVSILEQATPQEHTDHGHHLAGATNGLVCVADAFGYEPASATSIEQVEVVYAHHMCAEVGPGMAWPQAVRAYGPLAVQLTDPVTVVLPEQALRDQPAATHADRIRAIVPEQYHEQALVTRFNDEVAEALRQRFESVA